MKAATECNFCAAVNLLEPQDLVVPCCGCGLLLRNKHTTTNPDTTVEGAKLEENHS